MFSSVRKRRTSLLTTLVATLGLIIGAETLLASEAQACHTGNCWTCCVDAGGSYCARTCVTSYNGCGCCYFNSCFYLGGACGGSCT